MTEFVTSAVLIYSSINYVSNVMQIALHSEVATADRTSEDQLRLLSYMLTMVTLLNPPRLQPLSVL